jgi:uncharacterized protein
MPSNKQYIACLKDIIDKYFEQKGPKIKNTDIDSYIDLLKKGYGRVLCTSSRFCLGHTFFIENSGEAYPCSGLRYKELYLGNVLHDDIETLFNSPVLKRLSTRYDHIKKECQHCKYLKICNGGCMAMAYMDGNILGKSHNCCTINKAKFKYIGEKLKRMGHKLVIKV